MRKTTNTCKKHKLKRKCKNNRSINKLSVIYMNARSIRNKFNELQAYVAEENPDIICITESWLNLNNKDNEKTYLLEGYNMFNKDRQNKLGGGVLIYTKRNLRVLEIKTNSTLSEAIALEIKYQNNKTLNVGLIYRPPRQNIQQEMDMINFINEISKNDCVILGDFNYPNINWNDYTGNIDSELFMNSVLDNYLTQHVQEPTRGNNILDLVFSKESNKINNLHVGESLGLSDHNMIRFEILLNIVIKDNYIKVPNFNRANFDEINDKLKAINWNEVFIDLNSNEKWEAFRSIITDISEDNIPYKVKREYNTCQPKWFNREIGNKIILKKEAYKVTKRNNTEDNLNRYRIKRDELKKLIRRTKRNKEREIALQVKVNPKKFFTYFCSKSNCKNNVGPLVNKDNGIITDDDKEMAEILNNQFVNVFTKEDTSYIPNPKPKSCIQDGKYLANIEFQVEDIIKKLGELKTDKTAGPDNIFPRLLKECSLQLAIPLEILFRSTLIDGIVPNDWKEANITPLYKKGPRNLAENYRPISLTSVVCKVMESILKDKIMAFIIDNNLLKMSQHGFMPKRSCLTNLLEFFEIVTKSVDEGNPVDIIYFDFSKAFDTVPHIRLLKKLESFGICGKVLKWVKSWLENRTQRVVINGSKSEWAEVTSGVPQGSVLGPLLFLLYIDDIDDGLTSNISKFADDTKIYKEVSTIVDNISMQKDIDRMVKWAETWQMKFNIQKCKSLHAGHNNKNFCYSMGPEWLSQDMQEKDLGVIVSNDLKPSNQCIEARNKANKMLGYIGSKVEYKSKDVILKCYNALVRPHLEYCIQQWSPYFNQDIKMLEQVQRRAT